MIKSTITILGVAVAALSAFNGASLAADADAARVAIIDASEDTTNYLDALKEAGVKVIGRYFSRCKQAHVPNKRIIDNPGELDAILSHSGAFAVLSIYQFYSVQAKFDGQYEDPKTKAILTLPPRDDCAGHANPPNTAKQEGEFDADAAIKQAEDVHQPKGNVSAIYFGVDFDYGSALEKKVLAYFTEVSSRMKKAGYLVGVYGNGAALFFLKGKKHMDGEFAGQRLINYFWLNASRGHAGADTAYNQNAWDLFQSRTDIRYPAGPAGSLELDTDIQNPLSAGRYLGFWNRQGKYKVSEDRTQAVYKQRRFVCNGQALIYVDAEERTKRSDAFACGRKQEDCDRLADKNDKPVVEPDNRPRACFGDVVRIGETRGQFVRVDCNEDGGYDGWMRVDNLFGSFAKRPTWETQIDKLKEREVRRNKVCP
jgi:Rv2525c-like, glycoside hydrolase-like domain